MLTADIASTDKEKIDAQITIQDVVIVERSANQKGESRKNLNQGSEITRLFQQISKFFMWGALLHKRAHCDADNTILLGHENNITRLVTNEFFFFTQKPFTLAEFEAFQQCIIELAAKQPANVNRVLSSFAVKTPNNKIMNVVAHIECGKAPRVHFIVKNELARCDPLYKEQQDGRIHPLYYVTKKTHDLKDCTITLNGVIHPLSYENVLLCTTYGQAQYYVAIDVCIDYYEKSAFKRLNEKLTHWHKDAHLGKGIWLPIQCSHIVTSNWLDLKEYPLGMITHADPEVGKKCPKGNGERKVRFEVIKGNPAVFGGPYKLLASAPVTCEVLPPAMLAIVSENNTMVTDYPIQMDRILQDYTPIVTSQRLKDRLEETEALRRVLQDNIGYLGKSAVNDALIRKIFSIHKYLYVPEEERARNMDALLSLLLQAALDNNRELLSQWDVLSESQHYPLDMHALRTRYDVRAKDITQWVSISVLAKNTQQAKALITFAQQYEIDYLYSQKSCDITELMLAVIHNDVPAIQQRGTQVDFIKEAVAVNSCKNTALAMAIASNNEEALLALLMAAQTRAILSQFLCAKSDTLDNTALMFAIRCQNITAVKTILSLPMTDDEFITLLNARDVIRRTTIMVALLRSSYEILECIMQAAAKRGLACVMAIMTAQWHHQNTILHHAVYAEKIPEIALMLNTIGDGKALAQLVNMKNGNDHTALMLAVSNYSYPAMKTILEALERCHCAWDDVDFSVPVVPVANLEREKENKPCVQLPIDSKAELPLAPPVENQLLTQIITGKNLIGLCTLLIATLQGVNLLTHIYNSNPQDEKIKESIHQAKKLGYAQWVSPVVPVPEDQAPPAPRSPLVEKPSQNYLRQFPLQKANEANGLHKKMRSLSLSQMPVNRLVS